MRILLTVIAVAGSALLLGGAVVAQEAVNSDQRVLTGDADVGGELYAAECRGCHSVSIAPTLRGVINRPVASVSAFSGYSAALKAKSSLTWTEANLDVFLSHPQAFAPDSLMVKSLSDPQQRADIIAYIATLPPPRE